MKFSSKHTISLMSIMLIYILLAGVGIYEPSSIFLFPILSIPLSVCLIKSNFEKGIDFLFNVTIIMGIYLITDNIEAILVYVVAVCIPAYMLIILYKKKVSVPHMIMYVSVSVVTSIFAYFAIMKYLGIDYANEFITLVDTTESAYIAALENMKPSLPQETLERIGELKGIIGAAFDVIKQVYPAILLITGVVLSAIQMLIFNLALKISKLRRISLFELLNFKLSKVTIGLLFLAMILQYGTELNSIWWILLLNIMVFLQSLIQIVGLIAAIVFISKSSINRGIKIFLYILIIISFIIFPNIFIIVGSLDTLFNRRKAEIIV